MLEKHNQNGTNGHLASLQNHPVHGGVQTYYVSSLSYLPIHKMEENEIAAQENKNKASRHRTRTQRMICYRNWGWADLTTPSSAEHFCMDTEEASVRK